MIFLAKDQVIALKLTRWKYYLPLVIAFFLLLIVLFYKTVWSMVSIWMRSETFTHAFLVLPISLWLVWEKRAHLKYEQPKSSVLGMLTLFASGFLWLFGYLVDAIVVQQLAWVAALITGIWAVLGDRIAWLIAFPMAFLFFLVPIGEDLVPIMMQFTADFTVALVKLTGIPVYREGLFFTLPSGNWLVAEACSGIRYLIASVTLGCLYAYVTYSSIKKRLIFILISIIVPVIANGFRAYIIVMLGHMSDMTIATGVDHLIYGWLFFGIVIFLLISMGAWFRDPMPEAPYPTEIIQLPMTHSARIVAVKTLFVAVLAISVWPVLAYMMDNRQAVAAAEPLEPVSVAGWTHTGVVPWAWQPIGVGAETLNQSFQQGDITVALYVHYYLSQQQDAELINSRNFLLDPALKTWSTRSETSLDIQLVAHAMRVRVAVLKGPDMQLLVWYWYRVGKRYTSNKYIAKLWEGISRLNFGRTDAGKIMLAIPFETQAQLTERSARLQGFVNIMLPTLERNMDRVVGLDE